MFLLGNLRLWKSVSRNSIKYLPTSLMNGVRVLDSSAFTSSVTVTAFAIFWLNCSTYFMNGKIKKTDPRPAAHSIFKNPREMDVHACPPLAERIGGGGKMGDIRGSLTTHTYPLYLRVQMAI